MTTYSDKHKRSFWSYLKESLNSEHQDFTSGSIRKAIFMLAVPMMLEMGMESVFAVVDIFFVGKLGPNAAATVGLTESFLTIIYSIAIGLSMAATAMVARRVGEKDPGAASRAGAQALILCVGISVLLSIAGFLFAENVLQIMGGSPELIAAGKTYTRIMFTGNIVIMLLFLINGIFRGAGDANIAMRSLWLANICNIILCPVMIHFFGLTGAAIATTTGRGIGVCYQVYRLLKGKGVVKIHLRDFVPNSAIIRSLSNIASTATLQFIVASASWIVLARLVAGFGSDAVAGYTIAMRLIIFFLMPAWGMSNAAATLVGQNLGAQQPDRAEQSVWQTAKYNAIFMACVSLLFVVFAEFFVGLLNSDAAVVKTGVTALRIVSLGYIFYGVGMVIINAFNGAGDSKTPTWINLFWFWVFQIPFAYLMAQTLALGTTGVFIAIVVTETLISITSILVFRKGKWKLVKI
ncbi:MATE family efflux transporter [Sediminibacterium soli]|uniref:MATE family efflux transporter n=1 Tax=Sediminibacterium soli TaxID=2698829 RepID=UPI001379A93C|nr:MATE family efflux transporter [Sediminibacterium soli]NCI48260.1 MATE family efflux transporter [Sediminibacterium soli]